MRAYAIFILLFVFIQNFSPTLCSEGDRSGLYQNCVKGCMTGNCTKDGSSYRPETADRQDSWSALLRWSCRDDCRYHCMWRTVRAFQQRGYNIPKFHGKWPFKRHFGVQEPASAVSSVLNLAAHLYMFLKILKDRRFSMKNTPLLRFWYLFIGVCVNAWLWSTIFHTRDTPLTEFMDYAGALSMVMALFVASVVRVFYERKALVFCIVLFCVLYYAEHARYLYSGMVDYEYNMTVNVVFGLLGSTVWLIWALAQICAGARYAWRLVLFTKLSGAALLLELFDFPPIGDTWDAHALWHLSTAALPLLFYRFVIDDLDRMQTAKLVEKKTDFKLA